jgi:hypothetical protein
MRQIGIRELWARTGAEGRVILPEGSLADLLDRERRPLQAGERPLSDVLAELREGER